MMGKEQMGGKNSVTSCLDPYPDFWVKQTRRGCCQELMGCEALTEFKIATIDQPAQDILYSIEDSDFWCRMCCAPIRPWKQTVTLGDQAGGQPIIKMDVPMACHPSPIQCCFHKTMTIMDGNDSPLGQAEVPFFWCIPVVKLHDQTGNHKYNIHMPTCWGGLCVDCCAEGCCNCKVPFYIYKPENDEPEQHVGKIIKMWRGLGDELFTDASNFQLMPPQGSDMEDKARLLAVTMLINSIWFEKNNN
jgi:hypothetical protein